MEYFDTFRAQVSDHDKWRVTVSSGSQQMQFDDVRLYTSFWDLMEKLEVKQLGLLHYDAQKIALYQKEEDGNLRLLSEDVSIN